MERWTDRCGLQAWRIGPAVCPRVASSTAMANRLLHQRGLHFDNSEFLDRH